MLKNIAFTLFVLLSGCAPMAQADDGGEVAAARLAVLLDEVKSVSFYFLLRTGDYSFQGDRFKDESTIRIYRNCGNNCRRFMNEVLSHLEQAVLAECLPGQQNILIELGGAESIIYSYSGRMIEIDGKCYFNERGIGSTIKNAAFLFN